MECRNCSWFFGEECRTRCAVKNVMLFFYASLNSRNPTIASMHYRHSIKYWRYLTHSPCCVILIDFGKFLCLWGLKHMLSKYLTHTAEPTWRLEKTVLWAAGTAPEPRGEPRASLGWTPRAAWPFPKNQRDGNLQSQRWLALYFLYLSDVIRVSLPQYTRRWIILVMT